MLEIINQMRKGIKGDSAETIVKRVTEAEYCADHDRTLICWAVTSWLMENCEKYANFKPIVYFD